LGFEPRLAGSARTRKGEQTRAAIFGAALSLFQESGYQATTMRAIAEQAGVSLGNSYHYFPSKGHLVLEFYAYTQRLHRQACASILARERDLAARLRGVVRALVVTCEPFHAVAGSIFSTVADPASPLNPFGPDSSELREMSFDLYREVLNGSDARIPADVATDLPRLLWLYQMGVLYFWILDGSPGRLRTLEMVDETSDLIVRLLAAANLPMLKRSRRRALALVRGIVQDGLAGAAPP
jgi:AcrR family transcriptional regulator